MVIDILWTEELQWNFEFMGVSAASFRLGWRFVVYLSQLA